MTLDQIRAQQMTQICAPGLLAYQWKAFSGSVVMTGAYLNQYGESVEDFSLTITTTVTNLSTASNVPPDGAIGAICILPYAVYCNTGADPTDGSAIVILTSTSGWVEGANDRYVLGVVAI